MRAIVAINIIICMGFLVYTNEPSFLEAAFVLIGTVDWTKP